MFGLLKKKLKESVKRLAGKVQIGERPAKPAKISVKKVKLGKEIAVVEKELEHISEDQRVETEEENAQEETIEELDEPEQEAVKEPAIKEFEEGPEEKAEEELHIKLPRKTDGSGGHRRGFKERLLKKFTAKTLSGKDIDDFFNEMEPELLSANVAFEVVEFLKKNIKEQVVGKEASRVNTEEWIKSAFTSALVKSLDHGAVDLDELIKKSREKNRPAVVVFLGFNGSGKTTSIAKLANYLNNKGYKPVLAAGDTFRAAAIDQLEIHGERVGVKVIKHQYGADSAAVIFDAVKHAESKGFDIVLADTAGRTHTNTNLMDELKKVVRVNKPDLKILVIDGLTGNDAVEQAKQFSSEIGVDAVVVTKVDVDEKGGAILSVAYTIKKPILFLGMGQGYEDFKEFDPKSFVSSLLE